MDRRGTDNLTIQLCGHFPGRHAERGDGDVRRGGYRTAALAERLKSRPLRLALFAVLFRFLCGVRNISPVFLGLSNIDARRFLLLNLLGACLWATLFSCGGYAFAWILHAVPGVLSRYELPLVLLLLAAGWGLRLFRRGRGRP